MQQREYAPTFESLSITWLLNWIVYGRDSSGPKPKKENIMYELQKNIFYL